MRNVLVGGRILGTVGVEQVDGDPADLRLPDTRRDLASGDARTYREPSAVGATRGLDGQITRIMLAIIGALHAVIVDALRKVALAIHEAHGHKIHPLIARRLAVIAREHA